MQHTETKNSKLIRGATLMLAAGAISLPAVAIPAAVAKEQPTAARAGSGDRQVDPVIRPATTIKLSLDVAANRVDYATALNRARKLDAAPAGSRPAAELRPDRIEPATRALRDRVRKAERERARQRRRSQRSEPGGSTAKVGKPEQVGVSTATLDSIAACESGGDPGAVSSDGTYRGKYQFDLGTWASVGGSGDPASAPEPEQDYRAALLYSQSGSNPWPICG